MNNIPKTVLITGATSGIGWATAKKFADHGFNLIICGRRAARLVQLKSEIKNVDVTELVFDVSDYTEVKKAIEGIQLKSIDILINNAGNAHGLDFIQDGDVEDWDKMIDINIKGLLYMSRALLPAMIEKKAGQIINIGSIAGLEQYPKGNVYSASKHAVVAISEGMRMDLIGKGIKISCVNPGMVQTEFSEVRFKGNKERAGKVYKGLIPLSAEDIANTIFFIANQPAHVTISDITVLPLDQASATLVDRKEDN